jgi:hypothetical protein
MNHKLRVLVRVDDDPAHVILEFTGCLTPSDSAALMHIVHRAGHLGAGADVVVNLHGTSHLDPDVLLELRRLVEAGPLLVPGNGDSGATVPVRLSLDEPAELPICLQHAGADAVVLAGLESDHHPVPLVVAGGDSGNNEPAGLDAGLEAANSPLAAEVGSGDDFATINGMGLSEYFEDTLDPAATVRALSDTALCQLVDALYRHLDTSSPSFGAHTWYELATEELQNRGLAAGDGPAENDLVPDTAPGPSPDGATLSL